MRGMQTSVDFLKRPEHGTHLPVWVLTPHRDEDFKVLRARGLTADFDRIGSFLSEGGKVLNQTSVYSGLDVAAERAEVRWNVTGDLKVPRLGEGSLRKANIWWKGVHVLLANGLPFSGEAL
jgi:hypothetical protein